MLTKTWKQAIKKIVMCTVAAAGILCIGEVEAKADTATITFEKNTLGQGMIAEPTQVEFTQGETCADVLLRAAEQLNLELEYEPSGTYGFYLQGINNVDSGVVNIPSCVEDILSSATDWEGNPYTLESTNKYAPNLREFSYISTSGWTYTLNHKFMDVGLGSAYPADDAVIRLMFTVTGGSDITGSDLYTGADYFHAADKSELIRIMGEANADRSRWETSEYFSDAYSNALEVLMTLDASDNDVYEAAELLQEIESTLPVAADSIILEEDVVTIFTGSEAQKLTCTVLPENAVTTITWESSDTSVAEVADGVVTPVGPGEAVITAVTSNGLSDSCTVVVTDAPIPVEHIELKETEMLLTMKSTPVKLQYSLKPLGATAESIVWRSDDEAVASVSAEGIVTPIAIGETDIHMTTDNGSTAVCHVTVGIAAEDIILEKETLSITVDEVASKLAYTLSPADAVAKLTYTSDDPGVARVDGEGNVTAVSAGETDIHVTTELGVTAVCHVVVGNSEKADFMSGYPTVRLSSVTADSVTISWDSYKNAENYLVMRRKVGEGKFTQIGKTTGLTFTDTTAASGSAYYYSVQAVSSKWGKEVVSSYYTGLYATTPENTVGKAAISKVTSAAYNKLTITWKKVSGASGYEVYRAESAKGTYKKVKDIAKGSTLSYTDKSLTCGKTYYYKVKAYITGSGSRQYGAESAAKSGKPVPGSTIVKLKAGKKKATVKWSKVSGAAGYEVYRATKKNGTYKKVKTIKKAKKVSFKNTKLKSGKKYFYKVRAYRTVNGKKVYGAYSSVKRVKIK